MIPQFWLSLPHWSEGGQCVIDEEGARWYVLMMIATLSKPYHRDGHYAHLLLRSDMMMTTQ